MFKLVVLSVALAVASANPSGIWGAGLATPWATPIASSWGSPWGAKVIAPLATPIATPIAAPVAVAVGAPGHWIKKRSIVTAPLAAPVAWGSSAGWVAPPIAVAAPAPIAVATPVGPWGLGGRVGLW